MKLKVFLSIHSSKELLFFSIPINSTLALSSAASAEAVSAQARQQGARRAQGESSRQFSNFFDF